MIFIAAAALILGSCTKQQDNKAAAPQATQEKTVKIAYVDADSVNEHYQFCKDYKEILEKKSQTAQNTLNQKGLALQKAVADFQNKLQQGELTREQAESQQTSLQKRNEQLQQLEQSLTAEFAKEQDKFNEALHDSVNNILTAYNKTHKFTYILSKIGDNILLADESLNITEDVIKGLNKRYKSEKGAKKDAKEAEPAEKKQESKK